MTHTSAPWHVKNSDILDGHGREIATTAFSNLDSVLVDRENAARIVACVNAMEGIEDPQKHRETWDAIKYLELDAYHSLKEKYDQLLEALELSRKFILKSGINYDNAEVYNAINGAIAKAKGGGHE